MCIRDSDPDYRTPGPKLRLTFGSGDNSVILTTWKFHIMNMPTGYLNNGRLTVPSDVPARVTGLCTGESTNIPQSDNDDAPENWPVGLLDDLAGQCQSYNGTYITPSTPEELCRRSGISIDAARAACARYAGVGSNTQLTACLTDFCATGDRNLTNPGDPIDPNGPTPVTITCPADTMPNTTLNWVGNSITFPSMAAYLAAVDGGAASVSYTHLTLPTKRIV